MSYNLSKQDFFAWKNDPIGQEFFRVLRDSRATWAEYLVNGNTVGADTETAKVVGIIRGLDEVINFEVED